MWKIKIWVLGRGASLQAGILSAGHRERNSEQKGKIKGQNPKKIPRRRLCLNFLRYFLSHCYQLPPSNDVKNLWFLFVFLQESSCSNNAQLKRFFCFAIKHNNIFYISTIAFRLGSQNHLQIVIRIWLLSIGTIQQKAADLFLSTGQLRHIDVLLGYGHRGLWQSNPRPLTPRAQKNKTTTLVPCI